MTTHTDFFSLLCDYCDNHVPNGEGHYINDNERVCADCYEEATK
jgi:hypothetical protein